MKKQHGKSSSAFTPSAIKIYENIRASKPTLDAAFVRICPNIDEVHQGEHNTQEIDAEKDHLFRCDKRLLDSSCALSMHHNTVNQ